MFPGKKKKNYSCSGDDQMMLSNFETKHVCIVCLFLGRAK